MRIDDGTVRGFGGIGSTWNFCGGAFALSIGLKGLPNKFHDFLFGILPRQKLPTDLGFPAAEKFSDRMRQALFGHPTTLLLPTIGCNLTSIYDRK